MEGLLSALSGPTGAPPPQHAPGVEPPPPRRPPPPPPPPRGLHGPDYHTPVKSHHPLSRDFSVSSSEQSPTSEQSPAATDLDAIHRLSERLDDLEIEHNRYVGRESGFHLFQGVHEHLSVQLVPPSHEKPPLVDALFDSLHQSTLQWTASEVPPDLGPRLIDAYFQYSEWGFTIMPRPYLDECLQQGLLDTDRSFRSLCELSAAGEARTSQYMPGTRTDHGADA